ncbi:MAG: hypothetical protein ABFE08_17750 [Armatimonadia bacterium]
MPDVFKTMILAADTIDLAREICASFGPGGAGMFITPLSADGTDPATHYISSGYIPEAFAHLLDDPVAVYEAATAQGVICTLEEVEAVLASSDISTDEPFAAMARLGLVIVQ